MSTRSFICKETPDGRYFGIYCHSDGYLTYNGALLVDHYSDAEKVDKLIALGDLSVLAEKIDPDPSRPHSFEYNERQDDVCVAYTRDRKEKAEDTRARFLTPQDALESWGEYMYVFGQDGVWRYFDLCADEEPVLHDVKEDLAKEYKRMGFIEPPKDCYGFWSEQGVAEYNAEIRKKAGVLQ